MKKELSKTALSVSILVAALFGALATASAQTIYEEDWGSVAAPGSLTIGQVGWTMVEPATGSWPWNGIWSTANPTDFASGAPLPVNSTSIGAMVNGQIAMLYTTAGAGNGGSGDSSFTAFNPASYTPVVFNVELFGASSNPTYDVPVYFAVQVGGQWYVSTSLLTANNSSWPRFTNACMNFTSSGTAWNSMSISPNVSITAGAVSVPAGNITGVGLVQFGNSSDGNGMDYNKFVISTACSGGPFTAVSISQPPPSETVYVGGGVSFAVLATGTAPITYAWYNPLGNVLSDGPSGNGSTIIGSATSTLTISNAQSGDQGNYYVKVSNSDGDYTATSSTFYLTVSAVPAGVLYAETVPYQGPVNAGDLPTSTIGWVTAGNTGNWSIWESGNSGSGNVYCSPYGAASVPVISAFYTATNLDTGATGLPFTAIPAPPATPYVAFEATVNPNGVTGDYAYFAVQMTLGTVSNWYVAASPMVFNGSGFQSEWLQFTTTAAAWKNLTINTNNSATIGSAASGALSGNITGVGLVFSQAATGDGSFNFNNFEVTSTEVPVGPEIGASGMPLSQAVYSGAGVSFGVGFTGGTSPFTYRWTLNGVTLNNGTLADGAKVSGATTATLTITNVTTAEDNETVEAYVTDAQNLSDNTGNWSPYTIYLNVSDAPIGTIYTEAFPYIGPASSGNESIGSVGWLEALPGPWNLWYYDGSAYSAYQANPTTDAYYTSTATDTGLSGLPFPNIVLAGYENLNSPPLTLSAQIEPQPNNPWNLSQVTPYWAVQINGSSWYASASPISIDWNNTSPPFTTYSLVFSPLAADWNTLTIVPTTSVTIGGHPANNLDYGNGVLTGAGLVIVYSGNAGSLDFTDFEINGQGVGNIACSLTGSTLNLSWVGNPAVQLQSATSVSGPWVNVSPSTLRKYSATVSTAGGPKYYRLIGTE